LHHTDLVDNKVRIAHGLHGVVVEDWSQTKDERASNALMRVLWDSGFMLQLCHINNMER
jgi:hypothetical protein